MIKVKKISILILLCVTIKGFAQNQTSSTANVACGPVNSPLPAWYTPNWDWLNATPSNWQAQIQGAVTNMGSPFISNTSTNDMISIVDGLDYLPQQGWVLMAKDFGAIGLFDASNATPWFMLYNKYRGQVRLFVYNGSLGNSTNNKLSLILNWNNKSLNNSLLTCVNNYLKTNDTYPQTLNNEKLVNYVNQVPTSGGWSVTEFQIHFDPNTVNSPSNFQRINFDFVYSSTADVNLSGDFNFTTQSATAKEPPAPIPASSGGPNALDIVLAGQKFLGKAPKKSEIQAGFNSISTSVSSFTEAFHGKLAQNLVKTNNSLQNGKLKQYLLGAVDVVQGLGGGLGTVATVLDFFMNKSNTAVAASNESFIQPTVSSGKINLTGTIKTETNPKTISLQLPGTSHKYSDGSLNCSGLPIYDCPLGVVSMQEAPTIEVKSWSEPEAIMDYICSVDFSAPAGVCNNPPNQFNQTILSTIGGGSGAYNIYRRTQVCPITFGNKNIKSYKVTGDIKLALNDASEAYIESTKAALFFEVKNNNGSPAIDIMQNNISISSSCCNPINLITSIPSCAYAPSNGTSPTAAVYWNLQNNVSTTTPYKNYVKNLLNDGILNLSSFDNASGFHRFQTPFIDINKFKNTSITIEDGVNVYIKLLITLKPTNPTDDQTPIVYVATYEIPSSKFVNVSGSTPYPMTCEQKVEINPLKIGIPFISSVITNTFISDISITNENNSTVVFTPFTGAILEAFTNIKLKENVIVQPTGTGVFKATIFPNVNGCLSGANSLIVQNYFGNCTPSALDRKANFGLLNQPIMHTEYIKEFDDLKMHVMPNPNSGYFKLVFNQNVENGNIKILNTLGQEVYVKDINEKNGIFDIDISGFKQGTYYLIWHNNKYSKAQKFIIE